MWGKVLQRSIPFVRYYSRYALNRSFIRLSGGQKETSDFLQALCTNDIRKFDNTAKSNILYAGFLNASGRLIFDAFLYKLKQPEFREALHIPKEEETLYILDVDRSVINSALKHLKMYKLRSTFTIEKISDDLLGCVLEPSSVSRNCSDGHSQGNWCQHYGAFHVAYEDPRQVSFGHRILYFQNQVKQKLEETAAMTKKCSINHYHFRRILCNIPEVAYDGLPSSLPIPFEYRIDLLNGIDFDKGCYLGQELVIRTKHRGVIRKRISGVQLHMTDKLQPYPTTGNKSRDQLIHQVENLEEAEGDQKSILSFERLEDPLMISSSRIVEENQHSEETINVGKLLSTLDCSPSLHFGMALLPTTTDQLNDEGKPSSHPPNPYKVFKNNHEHIITFV